MAKPRKPHYAAALKILHYIKNEPGRGVLFSAKSELHIKGFSDADHVQIQEDQLQVIVFSLETH